MSELLRDGDVHGRYASRSEAVLASALAACNAGWTQAQWREVLAGSALAEWAVVQHRKTGARRHRNPPDTEHRLAGVWAKATRRVAERPPTSDHLSVRAELAEVHAAADRNPAVWAGAAGVTDRAVLAALLTVAGAACTFTVTASTRQLAEAANISASTVAIALQRLTDKGWLRRDHPATGTMAAGWRLLRPSTVKDPPAAVHAVLDSLPPRPLAPVSSARAHDAFAHTSNYGLGRVAARLFDLLSDGAYGGLTITQLAALSGLHRRTVQRHLTSLQAAGLVTCGGRGSERTWGRSLTAGDPQRLPEALQAAADSTGSTGSAARRKERYSAERQAFTAYWADFTARRGWAVQRGLYRPDQPPLPLPLPLAA